MSKHITDETYKGHELVITHTEGRGYNVDIRADDYDGDIIAAYTSFTELDDARLAGRAYIDGMVRVATRVRHTLDKEVRA